MISAHNTTISAKNTEFLKGDSITVRDYKGRHLERLVWSVSDQAVFVCSSDYFEALEKGEDSPMPIGFPLSDVIYAT